MNETNHYEEFCKFVRSQETLSDRFKDQLIIKFGAGQLDAYNRGIASTDQPKPKLLSLKRMPKKIKEEIRHIKTQSFIQAIKRVRELTHAGLLEAKNYVDTL